MAMSKTSWADEVDEFELPEREIIANSDGTKTVIEYRINEDGKKVKLTRRLKEKVVQEHVNRAVAERKKWAKFGAEKNSAPGPNISTTMLGEVVMLKLSQYAAKQKQQKEAQQQEKAASAKNKHIQCRICRGLHFTAKCPYKDTLVPIEEITGAASGPSADQSAAKDAGGKSSYVPPHLRGAAKGTSMDSQGRSESTTTIRISNLSENTQKEDVEHLCRVFGPTDRVHVAKDRVTQLCRGFAFVSFYDRESAERAIAKLNGYGFDHLILSAEFSTNSR
ncbi:translation initiation factor eIF3 subunit g [Coemansia sp. RSA 989]|nr:eukaryotic translation initiation factor 3 subunit G [Coemansia mojavensis]KAJ1743735.1 translation initiation factor eIF3 subunit g [Coemansia sp. RSA 1086]KAJ1752591.1 translation initiation factor eIF3 subunit g [Coemansia sp. RSA 1821]KAJ1867157.1 translation initiation factor eIF3 subunit g [Coemansia sp. RSA 989]KAJ1874034.1 translation initiation factor eIF3 subunit g [Coemansia sp. RSA 990]KAJ2626315.1 translation initiation factor eIF3 subunit g [Coemansia sp. RSA 1290]KAJ2649052.